MDNERYEDELLEYLQDILEPFAKEYTQMKAAYEYMTSNDIDETQLSSDMVKLECATIKKLFATVDRFCLRLNKTEVKHP